LQGLEKAGLDESQQITLEGNKPNQQREKSKRMGFAV